MSSPGTHEPKYRRDRLPIYLFVFVVVFGSFFISAFVDIYQGKNVADTFGRFWGTLILTFFGIAISEEILKTRERKRRRAARLAKQPPATIP
jgi:hypothetical protein